MDILTQTQRAFETQNHFLSHNHRRGLYNHAHLSNVSQIPLHFEIWSRKIDLEPLKFRPHLWFGNSLRPLTPTTNWLLMGLFLTACGGGGGGGAPTVSISDIPDAIPPQPTDNGDTPDGTNPEPTDEGDINGGNGLIPILLFSKQMGHNQLVFRFQKMKDTIMLA